MKLVFIIRYTLFEAYRKKLWLIYLLLLLIAALMGIFTADISITATLDGYRSFYAGIFRTGSVLLLGVYLIMTESLAFEETVGPMFLALPVGRQQFLLGKISGYLLIGLLMSLVGILPLLFSQNLWMLLGWWLALLAELWLGTVVAWMLVLLFRYSIVSVMLFVVFYVFARISTELSLQVGHILAEENIGIVTVCMAWLVRLAVWLVPALDQYASTARLIYPAEGQASLCYIIGEAGLYGALIMLVALHEIRKRQF